MKTLTLTALLTLVALCSHAQIEPMASKRYVDQAVAAIQITEHDPYARQQYYYGDGNVNPSPTEWFTFERLTWFEYTAGGLKVTEFFYEPGRENVVIPYEVDGVRVVEIDGSTFKNTVITNLVASVEYVGSEAFHSCESLKSINLPWCKSIDGWGFRECYELTDVAIPQCRMTGDYTFLACWNLRHISLPAIEFFGYKSFWQSGLTNVILESDAPPSGSQPFFQRESEMVITVSNPLAKGYGDTYEGVPVVRPGLITDALTLNGNVYTEIPTPDSINRVAEENGTAINLAIQGWLDLPQISDTNMTLRLTVSNEHILVQEVFK